MNNSELKQIAMSFYEAFNQRKPEMLDEVLEPNWFVHPELPGEGTNLQKYKPIASALLAAFPDVHFDVQAMIEGSDLVAVRAVITGTQQGEWLGIAPTGRRVKIFAHDFHWLKAGRIAESWHVEDWLRGIQQMRVVE